MRSSKRVIIIIVAATFAASWNFHHSLNILPNLRTLNADVDVVVEVDVDVDVIENVNVDPVSISTPDSQSIFLSADENNSIHHNTETTTPPPPYFKNSQAWLKGPRFFNANEVLMPHNLAQRLITDVSPLHNLDGSMHILKRSMSLNQSSFLNWNYHNENDDNNNDPRDDVRVLASRLIYLAIHEHQHRPARKEAISRYYYHHYPNNTYHQQHNTRHQQNTPAILETQTLLDAQKIGKFDYECDPDTKYLIKSVPGNGIGSAIRNDMVYALHLGLVSNRVVLFVNSAPRGPFPFRLRWPSASCDRHDMQCVFLPMSPCVVTHEELKKGYSLKKNETKLLQETSVSGGVDIDVDDTRRFPFLNKKILYLPAGGAQPEPKGIRDVYVKIILSLYGKGKGGQEMGAEAEVEAQQESSDHDRHDDDNKSNTETAVSAGAKEAWGLDDDLLKRVFEYIQTEPFLPGRVSVLYSMRPNMATQSELDRLWHKFIPPTIDPSSTIGLPIRASDKCFRESECFPFDKYMKLVEDYAHKRTKQRRVKMTEVNVGNSSSTNSTTTEQQQQPPLLYDTMILTSESKEIIESRWKYTNEREEFPFNIIMNEDDSLQGSGKPNEYASANLTSDEVMISTLMALKMQLISESVVINDCSNFHKVIGSFFKMGIGMAKTYHLEMLRTYDDPEFRIKCHIR